VLTWAAGSIALKAWAAVSKTCATWPACVALEASQGHVPEVQGLPGAFQVHVVKQSCAGVEGRSLEGPAVQCVHGPSTTV